MADSRLADLEKAGVRTVRMTYPDLHGISRGKDYPIEHFRHLAEDGGGFCEAIMTVDLRHNVVSGFEHGLPGHPRRPDLDTLVPIPWEPGTAWCIADLERMDGDARTRSTRAARAPGDRRVRDAGAAARDRAGARVLPVRARPDRAEWGYRRYVDNDSHVYTVGQVADPRRVLSAMLDACVDLGLGAIAGEPRVRPQPVRDQHGHAPTRSRPPTGRSASSRS